MKLLHELRRRQMFRLTGLYVVGGWADSTDDADDVIKAHLAAFEEQT